MNIRLPEFDMLAALHQDDPEALEIFRRRVLREAVDSAPATYRPSLERLLTRIEAAHQAAATPMEAAAVAFRMMGESVERLHDGWEQVREAVAELQTAALLAQLRSGASAAG